jgi:hypothetical protein
MVAPTRSGGPTQRRRQPDERRTDEHHCGLVTKARCRKTNTLDRYRRSGRTLARVVGRWTGGRGQWRRDKPDQTGKH